MSIIGDKLVDAECFRRLQRTATKAGYSLRTLGSGYLITTTSGTIHLTDLESVADTLGRLRRAERKTAIEREAHPAQPTGLTGWFCLHHSGKENAPESDGTSGAQMETTGKIMDSSVMDGGMPAKKMEVAE